MIIDNRYAALGVKPEDVFLLDPGNEMFLQGYFKKPGFMKTPLGWGAAFIVVALMLFFVEVTKLYPVLIAHVGILSNASVVASQIVNGPTGRMHYIDYDITIKFTVNGDPYQITRQITEDAYTKYHFLNKVVLIRYLPFDPNQATLIDDLGNTITDEDNVALLFDGLFALLLVPITLLLALNVWGSGNERRQLSKVWPQSHVCKGEVATFTARWSEALEEWRDITIVYHYQLPDMENSTVYDGIERHEKFLKAKKVAVLPKAGTTIFVVFFDNPVMYDKLKRQTFIL